MSPFFILKLKTGETLFAEIVEHNEDDIVVRKPLVVKTFPVDMGREGLILNHWIPYTEDEIFDIPVDLVYYMGGLKEQFIKYYGSVLMREELAALREQVEKRSNKGEHYSDVYKEILSEVISLGEDYSIKYGLNPEELIPQPHNSEIEEEDLGEARILH